MQSESSKHSQNVAGNLSISKLPVGTPLTWHPPRATIHPTVRKVCSQNFPNNLNHRAILHTTLGHLP
jgi:hypothetical protein